MAIPNLQVNKMRERCSGCCRNADGNCKWGLFLTFLALAVVVIAAIVVVSLVMTKARSRFFYRTVSTVQSNVVSPDPICEQLARETLALGGNSVDAAVAGAFCLSVVRPQSAGPGGGLLLLHFKDEAYFLDALDEAPTSSQPNSKVAVPGFLRGLGVGHHEFGGRLPFCSLILPSILLASNGFQVSARLADDLSQNEGRLSADLREHFTNSKTGRFYRTGETMKMEKYSLLLRRICTSGDKDFYFGQVANDVFSDLRQNNVTISREDLRSYDAQVRPPGRLDIASAGSSYELVYPVNSGSGGEVASLAVAILAEAFRLGAEVSSEGDLHHVTAEALKFAFARRSPTNTTGNNRPLQPAALRSVVLSAAKQIVRKVHTFYNYPAANYGTGVFLPNALESHTASISVIDTNGEMTIAMTTLTSAFGSGILLNRTGIIMNDALTRFTDGTGSRTTSGSTKSFTPRRRPISAMSPLLIISNENGHKEPVMALAANNGGNQMISATAQVVSSVLLRHCNLSEAFALPRIHYQLSPNILYVDTKPRLSSDVLRTLSNFGHILQEESFKVEMNALRISPHSDKGELYRIDAVKELE